MALCSVISVIAPDSSFTRVLVGEQRDLLQERLDAGLVVADGVEVVLAAEADELGKVLEPRQRLRIAVRLGFKCVVVAGLLDHGFEQVADVLGRSCAFSAQLLHDLAEARQRLQRCAAERRHLFGAADEIERRLADRVGVAEQAIDRGLADPATRRR